jgi:hypothetical protein
MDYARGNRFFYSIFLPAGAVVNLVLGLIVLTAMQADIFGLSWLELATGAFCCMVAGWLAAIAWARFYWRRSMARQVARWGSIVDTFFAWMEDAPLPAETVKSLKSSLEDVAPG